MTNELERLLGDAADGASRRAGALPVDVLRGRGVRRRRTRHASFAAVGVAAAFGLAFGAAQILPDGGVVGPAVTPTAPLPTSDSSLPLGACGSDVSNMPTVDATMSLEMAPVNLRLAGGELPNLTMTFYNYGPGDLELEAGTVAYLMVVKDGVVVGLSKPTAGEPLPVVAEGKVGAVTGFGPVFQCSPGEHLARDDSALRRVLLPPGRYTTYAVLGKAPLEPEDAWVFGFVGREGTLTVIEPGTAPEPGELDAVDVTFPACGEPLDGFAFPAGTHVAESRPLKVTVGHTGEDETGEPFFYTDGYGDQLRVAMTTQNTFEDFERATVTEARSIVVRDGVVVAELTWEDWLPASIAPAPLRESLQIIEKFDWVDCADGEHGQVPKGDYEILGWQQVEWQRADGSTVTTTLGHAPVAFTAYDFEDADNPGPSGD